MHTVIFGKKGCGFCVRARDLADRLTDEGHTYKYVDIQEEGITKADLEKSVGGPVSTVPQIFVDESHVGGFTEYQQYVNANK